MANHGILSRSGKNIQFEKLAKATQQTYNFAQAFCTFVPKYAADMLDECPLSATFDLADLDVHNGISTTGRSSAWTRLPRTPTKAKLRRHSSNACSKPAPAPTATSLRRTCRASWANAAAWSRRRRTRHSARR
ncbi:hypothetical protein OH76DRAFT_1400359 [Lentinus brumalis]|uniref:Heme haloperoxidase family profile domain-containing protein n=1 Tax=Lentinus brumalis TaxID=2498619 RepID=A0A371DJ82_9APHY|nr:hypothetical protein OH76DRAFT_1400359 [Polyporus brumalis]